MTNWSEVSPQGTNNKCNMVLQSLMLYCTVASSISQPLYRHQPEQSMSVARGARVAGACLLVALHCGCLVGYLKVRLSEGYGVLDGVC